VNVSCLRGLQGVGGLLDLSQKPQCKGKLSRASSLTKGTRVERAEDSLMEVRADSR
jgi:hypothetical protein